MPWAPIASLACTSLLLAAYTMQRACSPNGHLHIRFTSFTMLISALLFGLSVLALRAPPPQSQAVGASRQSTHALCPTTAYSRGDPDRIVGGRVPPNRLHLGLAAVKMRVPHGAWREFIAHACWGELCGGVGQLLHGKPGVGKGRARARPGRTNNCARCLKWPGLVCPYLL